MTSKNSNNENYTSTNILNKFEHLYTTFTLKFLKQQSENNIKENLCNNN